LAQAFRAMRFAALLGVALAGLRQPTDEAPPGAGSDSTAYVLAQYSGIACQPGKRHVCQHLTKGACTQTTAQDGGVAFTVHVQLDEMADGSFEVTSCSDGCTCNHKTPYTVNKCESGTYGTTSISYMLVQASEVEGCLTYNFDVGGGRHATQYEAALSNATSEGKFNADEAEDTYEEEAPAEETPLKLVAHTTRLRTASAARYFAEWSGPYTQIEATSTKHVDGETTTGDWGREYGYKPPPKQSGAAAVALLAMLLAH